ncbi:MAG: hypothetical protein WKF60_13580 [Ilumatobacter sp.]
MFVIAGRAPSWIVDQTRYSAMQLTQDGRVMVAMTAPSDGGVHLPGDPGGSTLLGIASSGYPVWTGRTRSAVGFRRRRDQTVVVVFDGAQPVVALLSTVMARLRRERVLIHDLTTKAPQPSRWRTAWHRVVCILAHDVLQCKPRSWDTDRSVALAVCGGDTEFARLVIEASRSMAASAARNWRIVVQSTDVEIDRLVGQAERDDLLTCENSEVSDDLVKQSDIVMVRHGDERFVEAALSNGAAAIIVGHPIGGRVSRRFDGTWLTKWDAASILVALESACGAISGGGRSAPDLRDDGDQLVSLVRDRHAAIAR